MVTGSVTKKTIKSNIIVMKYIFDVPLAEDKVHTQNTPDGPGLQAWLMWVKASL